MTTFLQHLQQTLTGPPNRGALPWFWSWVADWAGLCVDGQEDTVDEDATYLSQYVHCDWHGPHPQRPYVLVAYDYDIDDDDLRGRLREFDTLAGALEVAGLQAAQGQAPTFVLDLTVEQAHELHYTASLL